MTCPHRTATNECDLANAYLSKHGSDITIRCADDSLNACAKSSCPFTFNYVVASLILSQTKSYNIITGEMKQELMPVINAGRFCTLEGPGAKLTDILKWLGYKATQQCNCESYASIMNHWGVERCRRDIETITDWLEDAAAKQSWLFRREGARILIQVACDLADGNSWLSILGRIRAYKIGDKS